MILAIKNATVKSLFYNLVVCLILSNFFPILHNNVNPVVSQVYEQIFETRLCNYLGWNSTIPLAFKVQNELSHFAFNPIKHKILSLIRSEELHLLQYPRFNTYGWKLPVNQSISDLLDVYKNEKNISEICSVILFPEEILNIETTVENDLIQKLLSLNAYEFKMFDWTCQLTLDNGRRYDKDYITNILLQSIYRSKFNQFSNKYRKIEISHNGKIFLLYLLSDLKRLDFKNKTQYQIRDHKDL
jgi:hypothetical protein